MKVASLVTSLLILILLVPSYSHAKIYKWYDRNGTVHFSDKPYSEDAEEVNVKGTGITVTDQGSDDVSPKNALNDVQTKTQKQNQHVTTKNESVEKKPLSAEDYRIRASVGKLGGDIISISGRISSGPKCDDMTIIVKASNENGLTASITDNVRKSNSYGSTIFEGNDKVSGSAEDRGFWKVDSITITCQDQ